MEMQQHILEHEIVTQLIELLQKSGFDSFGTLAPPTDLEDTSALETILINVKTLNARYDKSDAVTQIRSLMSKYNIQLDQIVSRHGVL
jgi:hypothetical protein